MKKIIFILFIAHYSLQIANAQQPTQEWVAIYYGPDTLGLAEFIVVDKFGNVYVTGATYSNTEGDNIVTIKYSGTGVQQWIALYNGPGNSQDAATGMVIDDSANIYVTGYSVGAGTGEDFITIKYNTNGIQLWAARYNSINNLPDGANSLALDNKGFVYVTGTIAILPNGRDIITVKYNVLTGDSVWVRRFHESGFYGNYYDYGLDIAVDNQGNCYVTGTSDANFGPPYADFLTIKYNSNGTFQWSQKYDGPTHYSDVSNYIKVDTSGDIYITGTSSNSTGSEDYATVKYNSNGVQQWVQRYTNGGLGGGNPTGLVVDRQGNIIVTGYSAENGGDDYATVKYNSNGTQLWVQRYNGIVNGYDNAFAISLDIRDNIYVTGYSTGIGRDCVTLKYNANGVQQWVSSYNGNGNQNDEGHAIIVDTLGNVYVAGRSSGAFLTIKYNQISGINQITSEIPRSFKLEQNYPNPFNPSTKIKFNVAKESAVNITVFDVLGRHISTLVNEKLRAGSYETEWSAVNMPGGVYFYKIETAIYSETRKMILIK